MNKPTKSKMTIEKIQQKLKACQNQRDRLSSIVAAQQSLIEELMDELDCLKSGKQPIRFNSIDV